MAVSRTLKRLQRVLELEEEQCLAAMEAAMAELRRLEQALVTAGERGRQARLLVSASVHTGEFEDRLAGLSESVSSERLQKALQPRIAVAEEEVAESREVYLAKRIERRQAETLIEEAEAREKVERNRKAQASLDEWYLSRKRMEERRQAASAQRDKAPKPLHRQCEIKH
ncbi:hypothetical protein ACOBR2_10015 [Telmatobacter bradus]|uniref:hypothetical protein n=1 Tax=Telmatobacter bradus TaxID=474953 RepID=UPI003B435B48